MEHTYDKKRIILILMATMLIILGIVYFIEKGASKYSKSLVELEGNWTIYLNNEKIRYYTEGPICNFTFPGTKRGDIIELARPLENYDLNNKSLSFYTWHSAVSVYLDNELIYENGKEELKRNQLIGNVHHYIKLKDENIDGKTLRLAFYIAEDNAMDRLTGIVLYDSTDISVIWHERSISLFTVSLFMLGAAISVIIFLIAIMFLDEFNLKGVILSLSYIAVSLYSICVARCMEIFIFSPKAYNTMEYLILTFIPVFGVGFMLVHALRLKSKIDKWIYIISLCGNILYAAIAFILNELNIVRYPQILNIFYVISTISIISGVRVLSYYKNVEHMEFYRYAFYCLGVGSFLSIGVLKLLYVEALNQIFEVWRWYMYVMPIGFLISLLFLSGGFIVEMKGVLAKSAYAKTYEKLSYIDSLTELGNRRAFEREMDRLTDMKNFMILSFDINKLKYINDNYGHSMGDELIKTFANIMEKVAIPNSKLYRTGGDEFVSVVYGADENSYRDYVENMNKAIFEIENIVLRENMEFSAGCATSLEAKEPKDVFELSDSRMYAAKKKRYEENEI